MRLIDDRKFQCCGYQRVFDGYYWVLRERSDSDKANSAYFILDEFKYLKDGVVYFMFADGRIECQHRVVQQPQVAYAYTYDQ